MLDHVQADGSMGRFIYHEIYIVLQILFWKALNRPVLRLAQFRAEYNNILGPTQELRVVDSLLCRRRPYVKVAHKLNGFTTHRRTRA